MKEERILCAAIWYKDLIHRLEYFPNDVLRPKNTSNGLVFMGFRHIHCINMMVSLTGFRSVESEVGEYEQGFLTSCNRFVGREEAAKIAFQAKQISTEKKRLFSEDLY